MEPTLFDQYEAESGRSLALFRQFISDGEYLPPSYGLLDFRMDTAMLLKWIDERMTRKQ